jgi:hypothetical protein
MITKSCQEPVLWRDPDIDADTRRAHPAADALMSPPQRISRATCNVVGTAADGPDHLARRIAFSPQR